MGSFFVALHGWQGPPADAPDTPPRVAGSPSALKPSFIYGSIHILCMKADIHGYAKKLESLKERLKSTDVDPQTRKHLLRFDNSLAFRGVSIPRREKCFSTLFQISKSIVKPLAKATKSDIAKFIHQLQESSLSEWTKRDYRVILKIFYRFLRGLEGSKLYPPEVAWIPGKEPRGPARPPDQLVTADEVKALAKTAHNARDRAAVLALYESGCRVGEFLSMRIQDVTFDEYGAVMMVDGKTGPRRVRVIATASALASWLEVHPTKAEQSAPFWVSLSSNSKGKPLNYQGFAVMLQELAARANLKKPVNPHAFRHARATHLANKLTEAQMKELFGWTQSSDMASVYVHLSGRDVDNALLEIAGLTAPKKHEEKFKVISCPRCSEKNYPANVYCARCALALDSRAGQWEDRVMDDLLKNPAVRKVLEKTISSSKEAA